jgi:hypothetical protein
MIWAGHAALRGESSYMFWRENLKDRDHLEGLNLYVRILLKCVLEGLGGLDWLHLPLDRGQWRALVNTITNLWVQ